MLRGNAGGGRGEAQGDREGEPKVRREVGARLNGGWGYWATILPNHEEDISQICEEADW